MLKKLNLSDEIKIKLNGKRLYPLNSVKYLGVRITLQCNSIEPMHYCLKSETMLI